MSHQIISAEFTVKPIDSRCKYWAKYIPAGRALPLPALVSGANDVPGEYLRKGDAIEVFPGDHVIEGEENHHVKRRGWTYRVYYCDDEGVLRHALPGAHHKAWIKSACEAGTMLPEVARELLRGAGDVAACVRLVHYRRARRAAWEALAAGLVDPEECGREDAATAINEGADPAVLLRGSAPSDALLNGVGRTQILRYAGISDYSDHAWCTHGLAWCRRYDEAFRAWCRRYDEAFRAYCAGEVQS